MVAQGSVVTAGAAAPLVWMRIYWGALFAGLVVVISVHPLLRVLGLGIGINESLEQRGPAIWLGATTVLSLLAGGWAGFRDGWTARYTASSPGA